MDTFALLGMVMAFVIVMVVMCHGELKDEAGWNADSPGIGLSVHRRERFGYPSQAE
jgi:hypothetical protein